MVASRISRRLRRYRLVVRLGLVGVVASLALLVAGALGAVGGLWFVAALVGLPLTSVVTGIAWIGPASSRESQASVGQVSTMTMSNH